MPELPEVETVKETLKSKILNRTIVGVRIYYESIIDCPTCNEFVEKIKNQTIVDIKRRGKWLMFELNDYYLLSHLRMEGKFNLKEKESEVNQHEHVCFELDDGTELRYHDTRKFGRMHLIKKEDVYDIKPLCDLGLEPFDESLTIEYLKEKYTKRKNTPVKTSLLDQSVVVGIGNIYADEVLFLSKVNPYRLVRSLTDEEIERIIESTRKILKQAIIDGGTTIRSYTSSEGVHGRFQQNLLVHMRDNEPCFECGELVVKKWLKGRGTYFCPNCQPVTKED